jgi:HEPN domain-containing protein/predicted nucleotidyltransferase
MMVVRAREHRENLVLDPKGRLAPGFDLMSLREREAHLSDTRERRWRHVNLEKGRQQSCTGSHDVGTSAVGARGYGLGMMRLAAGVDASLTTIVAELTRCAEPELIVLFGSQASGQPRGDSDYDVLVVFRDEADVQQLGQVCRDALRAASIDADILIRNESQYRRQQQDAGYLDWLVAREGRVLYATGRVAQRTSPPGRVSERTEGTRLWRERAEADLALAHQSATGSAPVADGICFHAHAAIGKLLKAEIADGGVFPPRTHDLLRLLDGMPDAFRYDSDLRANCARLQSLYPMSRYPEQPMPSVTDAQSALAAAFRARDRILRR